MSLIKFIFVTIGTGREARTPDTWFWRPVLYQLSYSRIEGVPQGRTPLFLFTHISEEVQSLMSELVIDNLSDLT